MKTTTILLSILLPTIALADNKLCPIMIEDKIDQEEFVEHEGKKVYFCCTTCVKAWKKAPNYYIKVMGKEALPQFVGMDEKLKLSEIELLPQKFCPIYTDSIVTPESPFLEIEGKKVYFFKKRGISRWEKDAEGNLKKALQTGLLPQFPGNKKVKGKTNVVESNKPSGEETKQQQS